MNNTLRFEATKPSYWFPNRHTKNCGFWSCQSVLHPNKNSDSWNRNSLVQSSGNPLRTMTVFIGRWYLGYWMHFIWAVWETTLVCWRLRNWPNFQDFLILGHSNRGWLARHFSSARIQILFSQIQKGQSILSH